MAESQVHTWDENFSIGINSAELDSYLEDFNAASTKFNDTITELQTALKSYTGTTEDAVYLRDTFSDETKEGPIKKLFECKGELDKVKTELIPAIQAALDEAQKGIKGKIEEVMK